MGVGREKLQQFAWASGQTFLDGRAEKSLQMQGVSKVSQLVHAEVTKVGRTQNQYVLESRTLGDDDRGGVVGRWVASGRDHPEKCVCVPSVIVKIVACMCSVCVIDCL